MQWWNSKHPELVINSGTPAWRRLRLACELAKKELSTSQLTAIDISNLAGSQVRLTEWVDLHQDFVDRACQLAQRKLYTSSLRSHSSKGLYEAQSLIRPHSDSSAEGIVAADALGACSCRTCS